MSINVNSFLSGHMKNLSYCIYDSVTKDCVIVDPTWDIDVVFQFVDDQNLTPREIWLTHSHYDHIQGLSSCEVRYPNVVVCIHEMEAARLDTGLSIIRLEHNSIRKLGDMEWRVIHTPGHSPGGVCFYAAPYLICGDTLFVNGCGRADIPGADVNALFLSLQELKGLPTSTLIFPGHHYGRSESDTLASQLKKNKYLRTDDELMFIKLRMG
ncbi:MAG: MBL fold metallo-hydrolase [Candidatus Margulisiibacteriota bacterium]